ncbi:ATP-binding protein [Demequina aurantiaca]|uniref:ATP-binding protein n=1 Tax=Demequina aurantiaca TaxID=676200 RepID=UPI000782140E|nr:ATP-binding protein [Demequina aurantiaca]
MHANTNPFNPGAGNPPFALVGRDDELAACTAAVERLSLGRGARGIVAYGLRGTGKTVLLGQFTSIAASHGWMALRIESDPSSSSPFIERLADRLSIQLRMLVKPSMSERAHAALGAFTSFRIAIGLDEVSFGVEIDPRYTRPYTGKVTLDLPDLLVTIAQAQVENRAGIMVAVDEMQDLTREELNALLRAVQDANLENLPLLVCGAGLPSLPRILGTARSYAERMFDYRSLGPLDAAATRRALVEPVESLGEGWAPDALDILEPIAAGYPYFIQVFGKAAWDVAAYSPIDADDAVVAKSIGFDELDQGFFLARWDRATSAEQRYLTAMAEDGDGPSQARVVAERLGKTQESISAIRGRLIGKGIVFSPKRGQIAFTVPGMATFIRRVVE